MRSEELHRRGRDRSAQARAWWRRPSCRIATCAPTRWRSAATSWPSRTRPARTARRRRASRCGTSASPRSRAASRSSIAPGPASRGVHQLWFVDGKTIHCSSGAADFTPRNLRDDQFYRAIDVSDPAKPRELGRWWYPGTREGDDAPPVPRHPQFDTGWRAHNTNVYPDRPDRAYVGYIDGGAVILDISDIGAPKMVGHWNPHPPFPGFLHTLMPIWPGATCWWRATNACARRAPTGRNASGCWTAGARTTWCASARCRCRRSRTTPISGGRYGAHNMWENRPGPAFHSSTLLFSTWFGGGLRVHDLSNPFQPKEVASFVPDCRRVRASARHRSTTSTWMRTGWCMRLIGSRAGCTCWN